MSRRNFGFLGIAILLIGGVENRTSAAAPTALLSQSCEAWFLGGVAVATEQIKEAYLALFQQGLRVGVVTNADLQNIESSGDLFSLEEDGVSERIHLRDALRKIQALVATKEPLERTAIQEDLRAKVKEMYGVQHANQEKFVEAIAQRNEPATTILADNFWFNQIFQGTKDSSTFFLEDGDRSKKISIFDAQQKKVIDETSSIFTRIEAFDQNGRFALVRKLVENSSSEIQIWDSNSKALIGKSFPDSYPPMTSPVFASNGKRIAMAGDREHLVMSGSVPFRVWDNEGNLLVATTGSGWIREIVFLNDNELRFALDQDRGGGLFGAKIVKGRQKNGRRQLVRKEIVPPSDADVTALFLNEKIFARLLFLGPQNGVKIEIFDSRTGALLNQFSIPVNIRFFAHIGISPSGRFVFLAGNGFRIGFVDLENKTYRTEKIDFCLKGFSFVGDQTIAIGQMPAPLKESIVLWNIEQFLAGARLK